MQTSPNNEQNIPSKNDNNKINSYINRNNQLITKNKINNIKTEQPNSYTFTSPDFTKLIKEQKELRARINSLEIKLSSKEAQIHNIENKIIIL